MIRNARFVRLDANQVRHFYVFFICKFFKNGGLNLFFSFVGGTFLIKESFGLGKKAEKKDHNRLISECAVATI